MTTSKTIALPKGVTPAIAAAATGAGERLAKALATADGVHAKSLVQAYGADIDATAVKLTLRAIAQLTGVTAKGQGGAQDNINKLIKSILTLSPADVDDLTLVTLSRSILDAEKSRRGAEKAAQSAKAKELTERINDKDAPLADKLAALTEQHDFESAKRDDKYAKALETFARAILTARTNGLDVAEMLSMVEFSDIMETADTKEVAF